LIAPAFAISRGEAARLTGPNGAGKSTLLRALAGLLPLRSGDASFEDVFLAQDSETFAQNVAYAGHRDAVKPALTVRENLAHWAAIYGGVGVDAALERFSLTHIADSPAAFCSAGQQRRLGLARLMVLNRPIWLLDEPTVSLDVASVGVFADLVAAHCAKGGLAIAATHIEIGLPDGPQIQLEPPTETATTENDPFLAEGWT
ncbi:MAG: heme ABC exporter ATP-binding protein CcmA, partial [Pseudomonadota bacterium]